MVHLDGCCEDPAEGADDVGIPISAVVADNALQPQRMFGHLAIPYPNGAGISGTVHQVRVDELFVRHPVLGDLLGTKNGAKLGVVNTEMAVAFKAELVSGASARYEPAVISLDAFRERGTRVAVDQLDAAAEWSNRPETIEFLQTVLRYFGRRKSTIVVRNFSKKVLKPLFIYRAQRVLERANSCPVRDSLISLIHPGMRASTLHPLHKLPNLFLMGLRRQINAEAAILGINVNVRLEAGRCAKPFLPASATHPGIKAQFKLRSPSLQP